MLNDVNTTDIPGAIRLACETMQRIFNPDDQNRPYFDARILPLEEVGFAFMSLYTEAHVPGRHLHALLNAQEILGVPVDPIAIEKHRQTAFYSFSGPVPFPLNRLKITGPCIEFADHNLREGLLGLNALVKFRGDHEARKIADRCIEGIFEYWSPENGWDQARLEALGLRVTQRTFIWGPARAIGPILRYHQTTGSPRALELALLLADKAFDSFFREDGAFDNQTFGWHTHSTTCTLSSLAQLAAYLKDARMLERVRTFFDRGLRQIRDELGWVIEADTEERNPDRGEANNTGDILETALILGAHGYPQYFQDAERILRCHLLPAQLRDVSSVVEPTDPARPDAKRDVAKRLRGAFGFPAPYGLHPIGMTIMDFCLDVVGGASSSLCEAWRSAVVTDRTGHHVNMLFDRAEGAVRVESPYTHECLRITVQTPAPLWVRLPGWVDRAAMRIEGASEPLRWRGDYLFFASPPVGKAISIRFPLAISEMSLTHRTRTIRARLRGDEVIAMENHGAEMTFFPPLAG